MKIIVLDKCTVTKGDVDLSPLEAFGEVEYYDLLPKEEIKRVLKNADAVICNKAKIDREIIEASSLKFIGVFATGYNNIDIIAAKEKGIVAPIPESAPTPKPTDIEKKEGETYQMVIVPYKRQKARISSTLVEV